MANPQEIWVRTLKEDQSRKEFYELLTVSNGPAFKRLLEIVQDERDRTLKAALKSDHYASPSWALIQADNVGYQRALSLVETLLKDIVK